MFQLIRGEVKMDSTAKIEQGLSQNNRKTTMEPLWKPISELRPQTYVKLRENQFREFLYEDNGWRGDSQGNIFDLKGQSLLGVRFDTTSGLKYVDSQKNTHKTMGIGFILHKDDIEFHDTFRKSLPKDSNIVSESASWDYPNSTSFYILTHTRNAFIGVLNIIFSYPEAEPHAISLFKRDGIREMGVQMEDINSLYRDALETQESSCLNALKF